MLNQNEIDFAKLNGKSHLTQIGVSDLSYTEADKMPPLKNDDTTERLLEMFSRRFEEQDRRAEERDKRASERTESRDRQFIETIAAGAGKKISPVFGVIIAALGVIIGLVTSIAITAKWTGDIEARVKAVETRQVEDKQTWEYIRTQNEVNGKLLAGIQATLNNDSQKSKQK